MPCCFRLIRGMRLVQRIGDEVNVDFIQGSVTEYEIRSDESGRRLRMQFSSRCGTTVTHMAERRPGLRAVAVGTFDDPDWVRIVATRYLDFAADLGGGAGNWTNGPEGVLSGET